MRRLFDKLAGLASRGWAKVKDNPLTRAWKREYARAVTLTANPILYWCYGSSTRRSNFFSTTTGHRIVSVCWHVVLLVATPVLMVYDATKWCLRKLRDGALAVVRFVLLALALAWAVFSIVMTVLFAAVVWVLNTLRHALVSMFQGGWDFVTKDFGEPRSLRLTRYATYREVLAFYLAVLVPMHVGGFRLIRKLTGDGPTHTMVLKISDWVARLHPQTWDFWFDEGLPYGAEEGETTALLLVDQGAPEDGPEISERDKVANFYHNAGFVLIAEEQEPKTELDVFNSYVRERWANLQAAEIATDQFGRTWVVPFKDRPLFHDRDVATTAETPRLHADAEIGWMTEKDPVRRSYLYGRHWAAALADQDEQFLTDSRLQKKERALLYSKTKGHNSGLLVEHVMRGFDLFLHEKQTVSAE